MGSGRPRPHVWWLGVLDQAQGWELAVGRGHLLYKMAVVQGRKVVLVWLASSERGREQCQPRAWVSPYLPAVPLLRDPTCHPPLPVPDSHPGLWWRLFTDEETEAQAG